MASWFGCPTVFTEPVGVSPLAPWGRGEVILQRLQTIPWSEPACNARVPLVVEGDLYRRETCWARVIVDFPSLLGKDGRVAADSLVLCDAAGRRIPLEVAQDSSTRSTSAGPLLWLSWECGCLAPFEDRSWQLYFRTVVPGDPAARPSLSRTFDAQQPNVVFASGFEEPQPGRPEQPLGMRPAGRDEPGEKSQRVWTDAEAHSGRRSLQIAR